MSPHFLEACRYAKDIGYFSVQAATNGLRFALEPEYAYQAKEAGFVDGFAFDDELEHATKELSHRDISYQKYVDETKAPSTFGLRGKLAILYLDGDIVDGRSQHIPLVDMKLVGSYSMAESIKQLREDATVRAVVLRIESPGGS